MKKILLVLSVFVFVGFFCIGCKKTPDEVPQDTGAESQNTEAKPNLGKEESSEDLLIRPGIGVGKIEFGMTVKQMKDILGKPDVTPFTGDKSHMYTALGIEVVAKDEVTISAVICGNPSGIKDPPVFKAMEEACKFKTVEGIGIGSTEAEVLEAFGEPTKRKGNALRYKDKGVSIIVANDKVVGMWVQKLQ